MNAIRAFAMSAGNISRYYFAFNSYACKTDGSAYFKGADGVIQSMGPLSSFTPQVTVAGL